jgi:hypothetical protein
MVLCQALTIFFIGETGSECRVVWCTIRALVSSRISLSRFRYSERSVVWTDGCCAAVVNLPCQEQVYLNFLVSCPLASCRHWRSTNLVESHNGMFAFVAACRFPCPSPIRVAWVDSPGRTSVSLLEAYWAVCVQVWVASRPTVASSGCALLLQHWASCLQQSLCRVMWRTLLGEVTARLYTICFISKYCYKNRVVGTTTRKRRLQLFIYIQI